MLTFETLANRYHLTGTVKLLKAVHVGSGKSDEFTDSLFVKSAHDRVFIPGSSFRGALRSATERLLAALDPKVSCLLEKGNTGSNCPSAHSDGFDKFEESLKEKKIPPAQQESKRIKFLENILCWTCQVFGSLYVGSRVRLSDLVPINGGDPKPRPRYGVGINRDTETAAKGALYTFEVVEPEELFSFELWAENMTDQDWGVLALGLLELLAGRFWLGAKGAAGLGQCQLLEESLVLDFFEGPADLKKYLASNAFPQRKLNGQAKQFLLDKAQHLLNQLNQL